MLRSFAIALTTVTILLTAAQADPAYSIIRKDVPLTYNPATLSTEAGARALLARIRVAARSACGNSPLFYGTYSVSPRLARKDFAVCQANAIHTAVMRLNAPLLTRVYASDGNADTLRFADR